MDSERAGSSGNIADRVVDDYSGYKVYDERGEKLGKVEYTVLDEREQPQYLGVNTGFFGTKTTLIPEELVRLDDQDRSFSAQTSESRVKEAPTFESRDEISPDYESRVRDHYGIGGGTGTQTRSDGAEDRASTQQTHDRDVRHDEARHDEGHHDETRRGESVHDDRASSFGSERESSENRTSDYDERSSGGLGESSASGAAAGAAAASSDRDAGTSRDYDHSDRSDHGEQDRTSRQTSGGTGEQVRVTLKREQARAERVINEAGEEEVRIRKTTISEETLVDVEDPRN